MAKMSTNVNLLKARNDLLRLIVPVSNYSLTAICCLFSFKLFNCVWLCFICWCACLWWCAASH